jgi:malonate transporter
MTTLLNVLLPIFLMIGIGYTAARRRWVSDDALRGMTDFAFYLAMPCLLFSGATSPHPGSGPTAIAFFTGCLATYALGLLVARTLLRLRLGEAATFALNACFGNTNMIGIPVMLAAYGTTGLAQLLAIIALHSLILLPMATVLSEVANSTQAHPLRILRATLTAVLRNPIVMAVLLGLVFTLAELPVPEVARRFLDLVGASGPPVALFCLGASLLAFDARRDWPEALLGSAMKLLLMPLLVWGVGRWMELPPLSLSVAVVAAAMPTGANAFFLARRYAAGAERSGATVLLATLISVGTLGVLLLLLPR